MATIPVVWCTDPNSSNPKPTAFALRGIQLQGEHITPQHMLALKELVNAASEGRLVLPANGSIMFLDCGLNINSEVQVAHGSPISIGAVTTSASVEAVHSSRSYEDIVEPVVEKSTSSADVAVKDESVPPRKDSDELSPRSSCDSCVPVPYSEYELLYEFLCCAKCMNERLTAEEQDKKKKRACDKSIGHNSYARRESQKEPAPYMHFCDKAKAAAALANNNRCEERLIRKYSVEQKALNHGPPGGAQSNCRESADSGDRNNPVMKKNGGNSCNNCDTRSRTATEGQKQLRHRKMGTPGLVPPTTTAMMMLNYGQNRSTATDDDKSTTTTNDNHSGGENRVNAQAPSLHNARLGTALAVCGGRRSMNSHHHQLRNKRIDRNCGRISIRRSKRRVECPRAKKVLMTDDPQQQRQPEQNQEQRLRPRRRCDVDDQKIVVASAEISKREIERLLYARVNKLMKKKHRKEPLQCNKSAELVVVEATDEDQERESNEKPPCNNLSNESVDREFITPVIVVDPPTKSNSSSRKTSFDSTCTVNSHDSGFIDILNRIDNGTVNLLSPQPGNDPNGVISQIPDKPAGDHLLPINNFSTTRNPSDSGNNNIAVLDNGEKLPVDKNNKLMANLFIEDSHTTSAELKCAGDPESATLAVGATSVVGLLTLGATKIECLTQSKNRRKSYEEFRSMFRDSEAQMDTSTTNMTTNSNFSLKNRKLSEEHIEEQEEMLAERTDERSKGGEKKECSGKQYLLNPDQIHQIKMRRKSYEEFKLMMRDSSTMQGDEETFTRAGSSRFLRKNSNQRRKSSMFAKFATTKEESEQRTSDTVIYDLLPKLQLAKDGEIGEREVKEAGVLVKSSSNLPTKQKNSINLDSSSSINSNSSSLSRLKRKLRQSNSDLYEKLITYGTIYDIIQKKNLNYRKYDKYMTYGTIYEILHRKSSITSNQNTYENFNYFSGKKSLAENSNEKGTQQSKPKVRTSSGGTQQKRKSLSELVPYFAANFIAKDVDTAASGDRAASSPVELSAISSEGDYRVKSPTSCGTIYDMKRAAEVDVKNTRFTVHRIEENGLLNQAQDLAVAELAMISKQKSQQQENQNQPPSDSNDNSSKPVQRRRRRFSNILKLEYGDRLSVGGTVHTLLDIPQKHSEKSGTVEEHDEESENHGSAVSSLNLTFRHSSTTTAVGGSIATAAATDEGRLALTKALNDNYAKIKSKAPFIEKSSIFKSNSLDMLSNAAAGSDVAAGSPFGESPKLMGGYPIKKNNSDSSLSTKFTNSDGSTKVLSSVIVEAGPLSRPRSAVSSAAIPSKSLTKAHDLKMSSSVCGHTPSPPVHTNHNMHLNIKKFFGRKNATRRLSEFTRGEFLNEKA